MRFTGRYFELTDRLPPALRSRTAAEPPSVAPPSVAPDLIISVARRIVRSAVRRNTVKRIVREAWRAQSGRAAAVAAVAAGRWMIRLRSHPLAAATAAPGFATVKRLLRSDADRLFEQALRLGDGARARYTSARPMARSRESRRDEG